MSVTKRSQDDAKPNFLTPKNFYTNEVLVFAGVSLAIAFLISGLLILAGQAVLIAMSNQIFMFFIVFILLIRFNNKAYLKNKSEVEYLIAVNKMDSIDSILSFYQALPPHSKRANGSIQIDREKLETLIQETFGNDSDELVARFIEWNGDFLNWLGSLEPHEREKLYRHQLHQKA